jgi:NDP-sugar pyrophosphorylase family protein
MILAAGLGTRLRPITDTLPKALVEAGGKTLLEHAIVHLKSYGITRVIINVHHFAGQIIEFLRGHGDFGIEIAISDESDQLLDTGGGLRKAGWFFHGGDSFVVRNVDILSDLDLVEMNRFHLKEDALATLAVRRRETSRYLVADSGYQLCGWKNIKSGSVLGSRIPNGETTDLAFSGIQILHPQILPLITEAGRFSLIDLYLRLSAQHRILCFEEQGSLWHDAGKLPLQP